jgi:hypothetical protein
MPEFTVIEGGGQGGKPREDFKAQLARDGFEILTIELLRALARGDDYGVRVTKALIEFCKRAEAAETPLFEIVDKAISNLHDLAFKAHDRQHDHYRELAEIVQSALKVAAESMAEDAAAKARLSKRRTAMERDIESHMIGSEQRARNNGWSWLKEFGERHLGKWPAPRKK